MRKPSRKAQGMSLNVIIIAVIGIAILVILLFMVVGRSRIFGGAMADCGSKGGTCVGDDPEDCPSDTAIKHIGTSCKSENENTPVCCEFVIGGNKR